MECPVISPDDFESHGRNKTFSYVKETKDTVKKKKKSIVRYQLFSIYHLSVHPSVYMKLSIKQLL